MFHHLPGHFDSKHLATRIKVKTSKLIEKYSNIQIASGEIAHFYCQIYTSIAIFSLR